MFGYSLNGMDAQVLSQNEERLPDGLDDALGEDPGLGNYQALPW